MQAIAWIIALCLCVALKAQATTPEAPKADLNVVDVAPEEPTDLEKDSITMALSESLLSMNGIEAVRVKVFPHDRHFPPHFSDADKRHLSFEAESPCSVYEASSTAAESTGKFLTRTKGLALDAKNLKMPLYIRCGGSFRLGRAEGLRSSSYRGALYVRPEMNADLQPQLLVVNIISLESYLQGVVPAEVNASWPMETLKSQAVAARTYAVFHVAYARKNSTQRVFDVDDSVVFQAYTGIDDVHERTNEAIVQTAGQILLYDKQIIQAFFHADSGGMTAPAEHAFQRNVPYCQSKQEPYDLELVKSEWSYSLSASELNEKLQARKILAPGELVATLSIPKEARTESGRVMQVALGLGDGSTRVVSVHDFKRAVSLGSTMFELNASQTAAGTIFAFQGRGSGHGVGMNQLGAKVLADKYSWDYQKILSFYYTGTEMCSITSGDKSCFKS